MSLTTVSIFFSQSSLKWQMMWLSATCFTQMQNWEAPWPGGRASDSGERGRGFEPQSGRRVVSLSKIHLPPQKVLVIPRKRWLRPAMTEKLLTGTYILNPNKQLQNWEAPLPSCRASDSGARGRWFEPYSGRRVVSLNKIHLPPKTYW